jgi:hypothetical protein
MLHKIYRVLLALSLLVVLWPRLDRTTAQDETNAWTVYQLNMRIDPNPTAAIITALPPDTGLILTSRTADQLWVHGQTVDGSYEGWVSSVYLTYPDDFEPSALPAEDTEPAETVNENIRFLQTIPILPTSISPAIREIYKKGRELGKQPKVFTLVGDCNSDTRAFLFPLDAGRYDLGPYDYLENTVQYFSGSFQPDSIAGRFGYSALTVLDPWFADPQFCTRGENSVICEYRHSQPAISLILFGANDVVGLTAEQYEDSMRQILDLTIDQGIIPVLHTFPWCEGDWEWEKAMEMNVITVELAQEYELPLVNFWLAAAPLENCGFAISTHHLAQAGPAGAAPVVAFNGEETEYGNTLRNLLTLQVLNLIQREVFADSSLP